MSIHNKGKVAVIGVDIVESIPNYFPDLQVDYPQHIWFGYWPCSSDGLP
ncbi:hypothetical protein OHD16_19190 [Sphingobacterium sp. ML3W]|nr:hypothetical protein [Sphingobacterium sp. ML3W]WFA82084.1 hypothetical protein OGI71_12330 [Sphingobacterium sp. ML3W]